MKALFKFFLSLFRRDGLATIGKAIRYGFSPRAWRWLATNIRNRRLLKAAGLVDEDWYRREYPEVSESGVDPTQDFLTPPHPWLRLPNPDFVPREYLAVNIDVKASGMIPAVHYAANGIRENRQVSTLENFEKPFPPEAVELQREFAPVPVRHRRTAILASFSDDGRIKETVLHYLRGLREVVDNIVFVANCPIFQDELAKLEGLVRLAIFKHHGCYDFGSYKIGWNASKDLGLLDADICDELIVCNDSCYGPVFPFSRVFSEMAQRRETADHPADFWGMSIIRQYGRPMIPSYFYVFGASILEGSELDRWFQRMELCRNRGQVVLRCESMLTLYLMRSGFVADGLVPLSFQSEHHATSFKFPLLTMRDYGDPLVKIKALKGDSLDELSDVDSFIRKTNPDLAAILPQFPRGNKKGGVDIAHMARIHHVETLDETSSLLRISIASGKTVFIVLLSICGDEPWVRTVGAELARDPLFSVSIAAVPDMRICSKPERLLRLRRARAMLSTVIPGLVPMRVLTDSDGEWSDMLPSPGVVFYPSASDISDFHYNPHYAVGRNVLPILFFDRSQTSYPLENEFARQNYAYFWKIFFTDRTEYECYFNFSIRHGENAVCVSTPEDAVRELVQLLEA